MQVYNEQTVIDVLLVLKKRETKRVERSLEKFWHISEMREELKDLREKENLSLINASQANNLDEKPQHDNVK